MKVWSLLIGLVIIKFNQSKGSENNTEDDYFRLPNSVIPERYTLKIRAYLDDNEFKHTSSVKIEIRCKKPTNKITLHSRNLKITKIKLLHRKNEEIEVKNHDFERKYDFLHIYLNEHLVENDWYRLEIDFKGKIRPGMTGFYRSCYKDKSGQKKWIATTQFEPTNARAAFPCFDEPALKARFSIELGYGIHLNAISNMPVESVTTELLGDNISIEDWNDKSEIKEDNSKNKDDKWKKWEEDWENVDHKWKIEEDNWKEWKESSKKWKENWKNLKEKWKTVEEKWKKWEEHCKNIEEKLEDNLEDKEEKWEKWKENLEDNEDKWKENWNKLQKIWKIAEYKSEKWEENWDNIEDKWEKWEKNWENKEEKWEENLEDKEEKWKEKWKNLKEMWKNAEDKWKQWEESWKNIVDIWEKHLDNKEQKWEENLENKENKEKYWEDEDSDDWDYIFEDNTKKLESRVKNIPAIRNMQIKSDKYFSIINFGEAWRWNTFEETLKMSTYLVAYSINDFSFKSIQKTNDYGNTTINVWAQNKSLKQVKFATEIAPEILSFFEKYFDIAYPLPKADFLAVPDFPAGAIENWGLIMFRESKLLYVPGVSTEHDKHAIVTTMAHEIANYWFGDLVTIKWWSYFWLKQGVATYLARVAEQYLFPTLNNYVTADLISDMQAVYEVDALQTSRPLSAPIRHPSKMHEIYDSITNAKGSCVIRMIEFFLGNQGLRNGLIQYLQKYKYNSTEPDNLWNSLSDQISVKRVMDTWSLQAGYPLVTVDRDYTSGTVTVKQKRFLENVRKHDDSCYWVPLTYTTKEASNFNQTKARRWLPCPIREITFTLGDSQSWVLFNIQASGLYRVNYDKRNWKMLIEQLETNHKKIMTLNRVLLIEDVMELAMVGYVDFKVAFDLVKYVRKDDKFATWSKAIGKLIKIANLLDHTPDYELIQSFISNLVMPEFRNLGGIRSLKTISKFHLEIIKVACNIGNKICKQEAADMFSEWKRSNGHYKIPTEIREIVYCQGVKSGSEEDWDYLWNYYKNSNVATEKDSILGALGCTEKHKILTRYLKWMIEEDSYIRPQDIKDVFMSVVENKEGCSTARLFFYENVKKIYEIEAPRGESMRHFLILVTKSLRTETEFHEYKEFLKENEQYFNRAHLASKQTLEKLVVRKNWYDNIYPKLVHALKQQIEISERKSSNNPSIAGAFSST